MDEGILESVKAILGIVADDESFDTALIMHINSAFFILNQLGVGPATCYKIEDDSNTWDEFISNASDLEAVKSYVGLKVRQLFDPPTSGSHMEALNNQIREFECRLNYQVDPGVKEA